MWKLGVPSHEVTQKTNILSKKSIKHVLITERLPYLLLCKGTLKCTLFNNSKLKVLSPQLKQFLKEFDDVFPINGPTGLPSFRVIEHQEDFVSGASLTNRPRQRINPE